MKKLREYKKAPAEKSKGRRGLGGSGGKIKNQTLHLWWKIAARVGVAGFSHGLRNSPPDCSLPRSRATALSNPATAGG